MPARVTLLLLAAAGLVPGCESGRDRPVVIFHAASLTGALAEVERRMEKADPELDLRLEASGSQVAARKVAELGRRADLVLSADAAIIDRILIPAHADFNLHFTSNQIVLAHGQHSRHTDEIAADNWPGILLRPGVRLGRCDENLAPIGYQTLLVWKLAERHFENNAPGAGLAERLRSRVAPAHLVADITELVALLQSRAIDYAFVFRSIAEEHNLKITPLPPACNLGDPARNRDYARVAVEVKMKSTAAPVRVPGSAVIYGLTIPHQATSPDDAARVAAFLLGDAGRRILRRYGFDPLEPPACSGCGRAPQVLRRLVAGGVAP